MSENESDKVPLEEWTLEMLEARLTSLEQQMGQASEGEINQEALRKMSKIHSELIEAIAKKKGEKITGKNTADSWGH